MLVLSRKLGEDIFIGDFVRITVLQIDRGKIRLGIECPRGIDINRGELLGSEELKTIRANLKVGHGHEDPEAHG